MTTFLVMTGPTGQQRPTRETTVHLHSGPSAVAGGVCQHLCNLPHRVASVPTAALEGTSLRMN